MFEFTQRDIILTLIQGDSGDKWAEEQDGWDRYSDKPVCTWDGITCNEDGKIIILDLTGQRLEGTLPVQLKRLSALNALILRGNSFSGTIPRSITRLSKLHRLILSRNGLTGTIPKIKSPTLISLNVSSNRLSGPIDDVLDFTATDSLSSIDLSHNNLSGTLPPIPTYKHHNLNILDLSFNHFTGTIPEKYGELQSMQYMYLNDNELVGSIPHSFPRAETKFVQLFLQNNALSGTIPHGFESVPTLQNLFLDKNKLTGRIPYNLCNKNLNQGYFYGPNDGNDRDGCTSIACPTGTFSSNGMYPCRKCQGESVTPYLGQSGECFELNQRRILRKFYTATNGPDWRGGRGWGQDTVPICQWEGIRCDSNGQVSNITLVNMGLRGTLVEDLGFLNRLRVLNVADNKLTGNLPSDLRMTSLEYLDISGNMIKGAVPPLLCSTRDINRNGKFGIDPQNLCERVACPVGSYSPSGFAEDMARCRPCRGGTYLASKHCYFSENLNYVMGRVVHNSAAGNVADTLLGLFLTVVFVVTGVLGYKQYQRYTERIEFECDAAKGGQDLFGMNEAMSYGNKNVHFYEKDDDLGGDRAPATRDQEACETVFDDQSVMSEGSQVEMVFEGLDSIPSRRALRAADSTFSIGSDAAVR
mmetsp:Transcript_5774/g.7253  ORF Transcript_5774/g.7253 Transcript_5774/m.7253 type:complete len:642 (-) Transcript_5774:270-2195(-)|eukprot:CAMPEP_0172492308 /NCGR_PEP_ID=MMETSP1066-20121228/23408_1 /TAXON_ID=671091 /ORGANISM="Coscinodiscus wailesii, Strain CCMP2513" /LENGTH=641 /DNA_ID=CAMNT_0013261843 /DNA_START=182 /DNA_END=2107 /DNA_ORIENTATION=+